MISYKVYKITNTLNGKIYVGQTKQPIEKRFMQHSQANSPLGQAMHQCGLENFTIEVIEECATQAEVNERERFWIKVLNCKIPDGYNLRNGASGGGDRVLKPVKVILDNDAIERKALRLGEYLKKYREENKLTMQEMADACEFSKAYVSLLEKGINPTTKRPFSPTLQTLKKIAHATGQDLDSLLEQIDGNQLVIVKPSEYTFSNEEKEVVRGFNSLTADGKTMILTMLKSLCVTHSAAV